MPVVREVGSVRTESGDVDSDEGGSAFVSAYHDPNKVLIPRHQSPCQLYEVRVIALIMGNIYYLVHSRHSWKSLQVSTLSRQEPLCPLD